MGEYLKALLGKGYFPQELPPAFTTSDFGAHATAIIEDWRISKVYEIQPTGKLKVKGKKKHKAGAYGYKVPAPDPEMISCPKKGYERRNVQIPHPVPQALLALELSTNWKTISKWLSRSRYSIDRTEISTGYPRGIKPLNFEAHRAKKAYIESNADWIVKTDITRFYPSIYTHSIAWAAYGKAKVKDQVELFKGSLADRLDVLVRSCNRGQTIGIPVGPETSRIIAEVVSGRIDNTFNTCRDNIGQENIDRLQDDWYIGTTTLESAEAALTGLIGCYREFSLDINGSKTAVERVMSPITETWVTELGAFLSHNNAHLTRTRLREFLALTLKLQLDYPNAPVVKYALAVIEDKRAHIKDVETLESFLMRVASIAPGAMARVCSILINLHHDTGRVSIDRVRRRFTQLAERALSHGNLYEALWLLFALRGLKASVNSKVLCELSAEFPSSSLVLVLLDMDQKGLILNALPKSKWESQITDTAIMSDWRWLYAYEAIRKGWLNDPAKTMAHPFFDAMATRDVVFYDPKRNVPKTKATVRRRKSLRRENSRYASELISNLRGFTFDPYDAF